MMMAYSKRTPLTVFLATLLLIAIGNDFTGSQTAAYAQSSQAPAGWSFTAKPKGGDGLGSFKNEVGTLNEFKKPSHFLTLTVIATPVKEIALRTKTYQLTAIETEIQNILRIQKENKKPSLKSLKILDDQAIAKLVITKPGKGKKLYLGKIQGNRVIVVTGESRAANPEASVEAEFFKIASDFHVPESREN